MSESNFRIALTPGEPAGIGPEITARIAQQAQSFELVAVCDPELLKQAAKSLGFSLNIRILDLTQAPQASSAGEITVAPITLAELVEAGSLNTANANYVLNTLSKATELCMQKHCAAVVTGPVQKSVINDAGIAFSGHTEFFAEKSNTDKVVMMLATEGLRVALATTHLPLKDVSAAITQNSLSEVIQILLDDMREKFGIASPKILVCGLNPHAGEGGHLGMEEIETIIPVLEKFSCARP